MRVRQIIVCFLLTAALAAAPRWAACESAYFATVDSACEYIVKQAKARAKDVSLSFPTNEIVGKWRFDELCAHFTDCAALVAYADYECVYDEERFDISLSFAYRPGVRIADAVKNGDADSLTTDESAALAIAEAALAEIMSESKSQLEIERGIHDYIIGAVEYSDRSLPPNSVSPELLATNALINGYANCQGYADAFYMMCSLAGLEVGMQSGRQSNGEAHIWNTVKLDGKWFIVDATWDDASMMSSERPCYRAFNMGLDICKDNLIWSKEYETNEIAENSDGYYFYICPSIEGFGSTFTDFQALIKNAYEAFTVSDQTVVHAMYEGEYLSPDFIVRELNAFLDANEIDVKWTLDSWYMSNNTILALQWRE